MPEAFVTNETDVPGGEIAGYCVADDVSARDLQGREPQWTRAKGADTFCPFGPWVTTADEVPDPQRLRLRTTVNGETMQDSSTGLMIFSVAEIIAFCSRCFTCAQHGGSERPQSVRFVQGSAGFEPGVQG